MHPSLTALLARYRDIVALDAAASLMGWDMQVYMPAGGAEARSAHLSILSRMSHELWTSDETAQLLVQAESQTVPDSSEGAMVRVFRREFDQKTKLPADLVERKTRVGGESYQVWKRARSESNFAAMKPYYAELFEINREVSKLLDPNAAHPYDPLHDLYEEGAKTKTTKVLLESIREPIVNLVAEIRDRGKPVEDSFLTGKWEPERLRSLSQSITSDIGFSFNHGRLDVAPNAFCTHLSKFDVRMTTKPSEHIKGIVSSSLHEMGHGLYEQHSNSDWENTPLAGGVSLAVHESQSRMWENVIGRTRSFWRHFYPRTQQALPELASIDLETFYRAMNKVQPGFIRVGADELTYNLHILIRFEIEVALMERSLEIADLPQAWNEKYTKYLGITPPNDGVGVLQDVHWSRGSCGYFPTYSMGNLISCQVWSKLQGEIPSTETLLEKGDFKPILGWLIEKIYSQASRYRPDELVERVTGNKMRADEWLAYAKSKFGDIYGLA